jgi:SAM-dependent methyltransferase
VCDGSTFATLARNDRYRMGLTTVGCVRCGLLLTNPQPTPQALNEFYLTAYRHLYQGVERPSEEYIERFRKRERAQAVHAHIMRLVQHSSIDSLVDIGCAEGSLLRAFGDSVPTAKRFGVEINAPFARFANTYADTTVVASIDDLPKGRFDLVILNHVLEHVPNPVEYLKDVARLLSPRGRLYVAVPTARMYRSVGDIHIAHLFHYTEVSLARLLRRAGYAVEAIEETRPPNHPVSAAALAVVGVGADPPTLTLDRSGWRNVRSASRYALWFHLRRSRPIRWAAGRAKSVLGR